MQQFTEVKTYLKAEFLTRTRIAQLRAIRPRAPAVNYQRRSGGRKLKSATPISCVQWAAKGT
jgi:hypothetical protein